MYSEVFVSVITGTHVACNLSLFACIAQRKSRSFIYAAPVIVRLPGAEHYGRNESRACAEDVAYGHLQFCVCAER